jgi:hypothetical protein
MNFTLSRCFRTPSVSSHKGRNLISRVSETCPFNLTGQPNSAVKPAALRSAQLSFGDGRLSTYRRRERPGVGRLH